MLVVMNSSSNYRHIMKLCVCNVDRYDCMMGHCNNCLDLSVLKSFLRKKLLKIIDPDEIKEESKFDDFIENLVGKFGKFGELMKHHYIAKKQAEFFKQLKENLHLGSVIMLDFADHYSFLVQDAARGFHWNNSQATIHPFMIYYVDGSGKLAHKSYVCINDHKTHGTITVYSFLKHSHERYVSKEFLFCTKCSISVMGHQHNIRTSKA